MSLLRRWLVPLLLAVGAISTGVAAARAGQLPTEPAEADRAAPAAAVLSVRRVPDFLAHTVAQDRLRAGLDAALAPYPSSCASVRRGDTTPYDKRADLSLAPASNLKLLTATAALARLGPDATFTTEARFVNGTLWLVGGGDPLLNTADFVDWVRKPVPDRADLAHPVRTALEDLADRIKAAGVTAVPAGIMGDDSHFDDQRYVPSWKPGYITDFEVGPLSALDVNDGFATFTPRVVPAPSPAKHAADTMAALLVARGVAVAGGTGAGAAPAAPPVATVTSPPLSAIVGEMLKESDNQTAELVLKELGRRSGGAGSTAAGVAAVRAALADAGLPAAEYSAVDGSGLDRSDRATCRLLVATLEATGRKGPIFDGLPVAGRDGTLTKRFPGIADRTRIHAKTGTIDNVTSLSGFVDEPAGPPLVFSLIVNGLPLRESIGRAVQDQVAAALVAYPDAPTAAQLAPGAP